MEISLQVLKWHTLKTKHTIRIFFILLLLIFSVSSFAQKKILFDATKAETAANADWVIDADSWNLRYYNTGAVSTGGSEANAQIIPTPAQSGITAATAETYWTGGLSSYGVAMVKQGYIVETLPWNGRITFGDATNVQDLSNYAVYIMCEPNIMLTAAEKSAILAFVNAGGGLYMLADHGAPTPADRNNDGNSSIDVFNDLMAGNPFGMTFDNLTYSYNTTNIISTAGDPLIFGPAGTVGEHEIHGSTTITLSTVSNATVKGVVYKTGASLTGLVDCNVAYCTYGAGRVVGMGDSSPAEDITSDPGDVTYDGWIQPTTGANTGDNGTLITNATIWLAGTTPTLTVSPISFSGYTYVVGLGPSASQSFTLSGSNLTGSQVTITGSANYEVSLNNSVFSASVNVAYTVPTLASTTVYIRLKSGLVVGTYNSENVTCTDNGATPAPAKTISNSGTVMAVGGGSGCPTDLIISEYIEGSGNNKAIEIYNKTGATISLNGYSIKMYANGSATPTVTIAFTTTSSLIDNSTWVLSNSGSVAGILAISNQTSGSLTFNGDDAIALFNPSGIMIDLIGNIGCDPGTAWTSTNTTLDKTLIRNSNIVAGITVDDGTSCPFPTLATDWTQYNVDDFTHLGSHALVCGSTPTITTSTLSLTSFGNQCTGVLYTEKSYTVSGTNLTAPIIITPPVGFEISLTSGSGFIATPATISLPQGSGTVAITNIYVRFAPSLVQAYSGNITHTSTGATQKDIAVSGTGINSPPTIATPTATNITTSAADLGANLTNEGCSNVTALGIYWSTTNGFTAPGGTQVTSSPSPFSAGTFTVNVTGLPAGTVIYYQAFATNSAGTVYSVQGSFSTLKTEPTNYPTIFSCGTTTTTTIPLTWTDAVGASVPDGYLIKWSNVSYAAITAPTDGVAEVNGAGVQNVLQGVQTYTTTGLTAGTVYYFKIWSYTNSGLNINYKTSATEPQTTCTTLNTPLITLTGSVSNFGNQCINVVSAEQTYTVSGTYLTNNIIITAPVNFEISLTAGGANASPITLTQTGGNVVSTTIYVRFKPTTVGVKSGNITHASTGATTQNMPVAGTGVTTPTLTTTAITSMTTTTSSSGGNVTSDGGNAVTAYGVCWSIVSNPTIADSKTTDGSGIGVFTSAISGLVAGTTYYVRAYATNACGTSYGANISFTTLKLEPTNFPTLFACGITTSSTIPLTWTDAIGAVLPDGYLIKWSSVSYAAITDPVDGTAIANGAGVQNVAQGVQTYTATGLIQNTTYYFKIWSFTNSGTGINYKIIGEPQTTCTTLSGPCVSVGFEGSLVDPAGWSNSSGYYVNGAANAHGGTYYAGENAINDWIKSQALTNPSSISFWCLASGATSNFSISFETSIDGVNWVNVATYVANGSNTGDVTTTYSQKTVSLSSNVIAVRWFMTARTAGSFYFDDVDVSCYNNTITTTSVSGNPFTISCSSNATSTVNFTSVGTYTGNTYTAQLSNSVGSFAAPLVIGTLVSNANSGAIPVTIPGYLASGANYLIRVISNSPSIIGSNSGLISITNSTPCVITTGAITGGPYSVTCNIGAIGTVAFTSNALYSGNTYTAQLSSSTGSFTTPTNIGTLVSDANSGTINFIIPPGTASGVGYKIRVISSSPNVIGSLSAAFAVTLTGVCNVFEIQSILIDACEGTGTEGENEMVRFQIGPNAMNTSSLTVSWPTATNNWLGVCQNATTASTVAAINATITGGGGFIEPTGGVLPANAQVMIFTSTAFNYALFDFSSLNYTLYAIFQCPGNTAGHFGNYNATPGSNRTLTMTFTTFGSDAVTYDAHLVYYDFVAGNGNGGAVDFDPNGTPHYGTTGGCFAPTVPLPIELLSFSGNVEEKKIHLFWQTATEINNDYFELYKSIDLGYFEKIETVAGAGNSNSILNYNFIDYNPFNGNNYYKLKQVDFDGNFSESNTILVQFQNAGNINIYYNNENNVVVSNTSNKIDNIEITDVTGKILTSLINNFEESQIQINVGNITPGIYFVKVICNNETTVKKIFIE